MILVFHFSLTYLFKHFTVHIEHGRKTAIANECELIARSGTCHLRPAKISVTKLRLLWRVMSFRFYSAYFYFIELFLCFSILLFCVCCWLLLANEVVYIIIIISANMTEVMWSFCHSVNRMTGWRTRNGRQPNLAGMGKGWPSTCGFRITFSFSWPLRNREFVDIC